MLCVNKKFYLPHPLGVWVGVDEWFGTRLFWFYQKLLYKQSFAHHQEYSKDHYPPIHNKLYYIPNLRSIHHQQIESLSVCADAEANMFVKFLLSGHWIWELCNLQVLKDKFLHFLKTLKLHCIQQLWVFLCWSNSYLSLKSWETIYKNQAKNADSL